MRDERNDLIKIGDAIEAITDWLCEEELRHGIEPSRRINRFFATVMLENVPRAEQTEPNSNADQRFQHVEYVEDDELKRCRECKHCVGEYHTPISASGRYYAYITCTANRCNYEQTEPQTEVNALYDQIVEDIDTRVRCANAKKVEDEPQTDCTEALTLLWIKNMVTDEEFYRIDARLKCISCKWWNDTIVGDSECVSKECTYQPKDEPQTERSE